MQKIGVHSIEDCLEILTGLQKHDLEFTIDISDRSLLESIARQTLRGTALTDRQRNLVKEKLDKYKIQFESQGIIAVDRALERLRNPLREIDRSKYITVVDHPDDIVYPSDDRGKFIKIRFPFKKSDIALINQINNTKDYHHKKGSHEHFFAFNETNTYNLLSRFIDKNYKIDSELVDVYQKILNIRENEQAYVPGIYQDTLTNMHPNALANAVNEIGEFDQSSALLYVDRRYRYGIERVDAIEPRSVIESVAYRNNLDYQSKPSEQSLSDILLAMWNLKRFPLLVVLEKSHAENQLHAMANFYRDILPAEQQSVLFRQDGDTGFNQLVKDRGLNNWVDNNTKIVYISSDKLPKLLISGEWQPNVTFSYTSRLDRTVDSYIHHRCDLIVYREDMISPMRRYSQYYG